MKVIYVCGPYRGVTQHIVDGNIERARAMSIVLWNLGWAVICPHTMSIGMGAVEERTIMDGDLEFVRRADAIMLLDQWHHSEGSQAEYELAASLNKDIYFETDYRNSEIPKP